MILINKYTQKTFALHVYKNTTLRYNYQWPCSVGIQHGDEVARLFIGGLFFGLLAQLVEQRTLNP